MQIYFPIVTFHTEVVTKMRKKDRLKELLVFIRDAKSFIHERRTIKTPTSLRHPHRATSSLGPESVRPTAILCFRLSLTD